MKKAVFSSIVLVAIFSLALAVPAAFAQKTEKSLGKVLESRRQKEAYEIRALKITQIEKRQYGATKGQFDAVYQESEISKFNADGLITEKTLLYHNPKTNAYEPGERREYRYDERMNPKSEEIFRPDPKSGALTTFEKWEYVFGENDLKQSEQLTDTRNSRQIESGLYKYEKTNNVLYEKRLKGELAETEKRAFDVNNNEIACEKADGSGAVVEKVLTSYDEAGSKVETLVFHCGDSPDTKITYDKLENVTGVYRMKDGAVVEKTITGYDEAGNKTCEVCTAGDSMVYMETFKYDDLRNMTEKTRFNRAGLEYKLACKYDEANNRVEELTYRGGQGGSSELNLVETARMAYNDVRKITSRQVFDGRGVPLRKTQFEYEIGK